MERDMLGILVCAYLVSNTVGLPLTLFFFSFNFFHIVRRPKKRGFPLFFVVFICSNVVLFIVIVLCVFVWFAVPP